MPFICVLLLFVLSSAVLPAKADVYKCPDAQGKVHFQSTPCTGHETPVVLTIPPAPSPVLVPTPTPPPAPFTPQPNSMSSEQWS